MINLNELKMINIYSQSKLSMILKLLKYMINRIMIKSCHDFWYNIGGCYGNMNLGFGANLWGPPHYMIVLP